MGCYRDFIRMNRNRTTLFKPKRMWKEMTESPSSDPFLFYVAESHPTAVQRAIAGIVVGVVIMLLTVLSRSLMASPVSVVQNPLAIGLTIGVPLIILNALGLWKAVRRERLRREPPPTKR